MRIRGDSLRAILLTAQQALDKLQRAIPAQESGPLCVPWSKGADSRAN